MQNVGLLKFGGRTAGAVIEWPRSLNYGNAGRLHETKTTPSAVLQKKCAQMFKIQKSEKMFWLFVSHDVWIAITNEYFQML